MFTGLEVIGVFTLLQTLACRGLARNGGTFDPKKKHPPLRNPSDTGYEPSLYNEDTSNLHVLFSSDTVRS